MICCASVISGNDSITVNETENLPAGSATIDNQPAITFSAIGTAGANPVRISALGGDDEITINQAVVWGITGVSVDGGPPTGSDTLQVNGTASPDDFTFDPTTRVVTVSPNSANKVTYTTTNVEKFVLDGAAPSVLPGDVLTVASTMVGTASLPNGTLTASGLTLNYQNFERIVVDAVPTLASDANTPAGNGAALPRLIEDSTVILDILANDTFAASIGIGGATIQLATTPTNGTVVILLANDPANPTSVSPLTAHQVIRYTPAANFFGVDSFTYRAVDRLGQVSVATTTVTVTVNPVNDQPTFNLINTPVTVAENDTGATLTAQVATNISVGPANEVAAGQTPTFVVTNSNNALFATQPTISPTGQLSYVLAADQNGSATITVFMQDGGGTADGGVDTSPTFQFVLNVTPVNDAPTLTAAADVVTNEDTAVAVPGIVVNDVDSAVPVATNFDVTVTLALTQPAIGTLTAQPANGVTVSGNGSANLSISGPRTLVNAVLGTLLYTPNLNQNGVDTITVTVDDQGNIGGGNLTATDTITVTVNAVNDAPVATGESYTTNEDVALVVAAPGVLANDTDVDGPAQTAVLVTGAANGVVVLNLDGSFTYTPNVDFNGTDSFTYQVDDTAGANNLSNIVTVTITVTAVNDAPVNGVPGAQATNEDTALVFTGANALTVSDPSDGNQGELTVTITVTNGTFSLFSVAGLTAVGGNGTDTVIATGTVAALNAALNGSSYTPSLNYFGGALLTLTTNDNGNVGTGPAVGLSDSDTVAITVNAVNDAPVASPDVYTTLEDTTLTVPAAGVLTNDTDVDGPAQTAVLVTTTANGALTLNADGSFTYAPNLNFNGTDSFTYRANDTAGANNLSNIVTVTINVTAVNDTPVNTLPAQVGTEDTTTPVVGLAVTDVDSLAGDVTVTLDVTNGTLAGTGFTPASGATISFTGTQAAVNAALATVSFTPSLNFNGVATLTMTTTDNGNTGIGGPLTDTDVTTITVAAVNDAPVATNSVATVAEDNFVDVDLKPLVSDVETPVANLIFNVGVSTNGVTIDLGNGVFRFIPDFNYSGPASFTYSVTDTGDNGSPALTSNVATVSVTVTPVADAPTLTVTSPVAGNEGAAIPLTITAAPTDPSETVTVSITGFPAGTVFNRGINDGVTVELTTAQLAGLTVTFPDGAVGGTVYNLQVTAISTESDGSTANTPIAPATNLVVTVNNVNPTGTLVNGGPVNEGSTGTVTFTAQADPAQDDVVAGFHYAYDFNNDGTFEVGNGTYAGSPSTASATVPASFFSDGPGTRTVRARIIDKDGGFTDSTTTITIDNVAPTATFGVGAPLIPGQPVAVSFSNQADPSAADVAAGFTYQYDLGNGVFGAVTTSATATFTPPAPGTYTIRGRIIDKDGGVTEYTAGGNALVVVPNVDMYAVGSGNGGGPIVNVYRASDNTLVTTIVAYEPQFRGGVNVAVADVTGDGIPDIITGTGVGGGPVVKVFDGKDFSLVSSFFAAEPTFRGGVRVAAGDISGTGVSSVVTGSGDGGGPVVRTFTGLGTQLSSFFAYAPTFRGGVNVGVAKLAATGPASILTGAGFGGGPNVKVFNATGTQQQSFFAYESTFTGGVYVSGGFVNGAGAIYTGTGLGGGAVLKQFSATGVEQKSQAAFGLDAYGRQLRDGFTVSATHIAGANGRPVVIVGAGPNYGPTVRVLDAATLTQDAEFLPYEESFTGGVYVG